MNLASSYIDEKEIVIRIGVAAILGGIIGLEREQKEWVAGLRTHILVTVGATLAMIVSTHGYEDVLGKKGFDIDPSRVAAQVVSGVGFLGAGTIIFLKKEIIKGLTTAASIWSVAVVGLAIGGGMYWAGVVTTLLMLFVLGGIKWIDKRFFTKNSYHSIRLKLKEGTFSKLTTIEMMFSKHKMPLSEINYSINKSDHTANFNLGFEKKQQHQHILKVLEEMQRSIEIIEFDLTT